MKRCLLCWWPWLELHEANHGTHGGGKNLVQLDLQCGGFVDGEPLVPEMGETYNQV